MSKRTAHGISDSRQRASRMLKSIRLTNAVPGDGGVP
jgi:hypothetical protein